MMVFGFGSYFTSKLPYRDIDILIVHDSASLKSCLKAIELKRNIIKEIHNAKITMLSKTAEEDFSFIKVSRAILLDQIDERYQLPPIDKIVNIVISFREMQQANITSTPISTPLT